MNEDELSSHIVTAAIEVHRTLGGPGLLEKVYEEALVWELRQRWLAIERQKEIPIIYKATLLSEPLRLDVVVNNRVLVEYKATSIYHPIFEAQALTYLKDFRLKVGTRDQFW